MFIESVHIVVYSWWHKHAIWNEKLDNKENVLSCLYLSIISLHVLTNHCVWFFFNKMITRCYAVTDNTEKRKHNSKRPPQSPQPTWLVTPARSSPSCLKERPTTECVGERLTLYVRSLKYNEERVWKLNPPLPSRTGVAFAVRFTRTTRDIVR